jgi:hypothetical protein
MPTPTSCGRQTRRCSIVIMAIATVFGDPSFAGNGGALGLHPAGRLGCSSLGSCRGLGGRTGGPTHFAASGEPRSYLRWSGRSVASVAASEPVWRAATVANVPRMTSWRADSERLRSLAVDKPIATMAVTGFPAADCSSRRCGAAVGSSGSTTCLLPPTRGTGDLISRLHRRFPGHPRSWVDPI